MLMFWKPGAGKGTLTSWLVEKYDILSLSTGDLLRQHIAEGTDIGRQAETIVARGALLPDQVMLRVVTTKLDSLHNKHWILDGFPRTIGQGELLDAHLKKKNTPLTLVVNLDVSDDVISSRVSNRWVHLPSGRVYNLSYNPPKVQGRDDYTGELLTKRPDDNPETFSRRLAQFYNFTSPLLSYYTNSHKQQSATRKSHQHPHQLAFLPSTSGLKVRTFEGLTSDENWPHLDRLIQTAFPGVKKRNDTLKMKGPALSKVIWAGKTQDSIRN
jgi:adenylate kinase